MLTEPVSMDDLVYFTSRSIGKKGHAKAWVYKGICPECKKSRLGKPVGKNGKVKIRANEYVCPSCKFTINKQTCEDSLIAEIKYTCPSCSNTAEKRVPFNRKKVKIVDEESGKQISGEAIRFCCSSCNATIDVMKKMKT